MSPDAIAQLIASRRNLVRLPDPGSRFPSVKTEAEGGCGVVGLACTVPVVGRHILAPCGQMHNRGNGKGGGLAAAGLVAPQMRVDDQTLRSDYLIQIALLDPSVRDEVVRQFIEPVLDVRVGYRIPTVDDYRDVEGLEVRPPDVWRFFGRVRDDVVGAFIDEHRLTALDRQAAEDEFIAQWAFRLNKTFYGDGPSTSLGAGRMKAFVISYGRDMLVLKIVGYAEQALRYYRMEDVQARVWVGHQRYPTKGRVWHPGGAHPFAALDVALVHNGDFANYHAVCEYLAQRGMYPLFLTDTEVSVLLFDLWSRVYRYPMEHLVEAMAPTTERDFLMLPAERQRIYRAVQAAHMHGSPDGPWFFIIARTLTGAQDGSSTARPSTRSARSGHSTRERPARPKVTSEPRSGKSSDAAPAWQLIGITDTSMLRPQVFALQEGAVSVGVIASEKQAIDATLASLSHEDARICPVADRYWNARGGSYTDGGTFLFTVTGDGRLICTNKFGERVTTPPGQSHYVPLIEVAAARAGKAPQRPIRGGADGFPEPDVSGEPALTAQGRNGLRQWNYETLVAWLDAVCAAARGAGGTRRISLGALTALLDRRSPTGAKKRSSIVALLHTAIYGILRDVPPGLGTDGMVRIDWAQREALAAPPAPDTTLVVDAGDFPSESAHSAALFLVRAFQSGWRSFTVFNLRGQRFLGSGFGPRTNGVRIDVYGSPGDYLASGMDGIEMHVHNDAQDQVGQILKWGRLVIHGSVGQTLLYGAKGGEVYILGHAAGRPLINAVGRPRVVINGTALDYLAESFMAGDPVDGGGFVILNGITFDADGAVVDLDAPYPGGNLFSLASGGAIYARDPHHRLDEEQLNGGRFTALADADWRTILPYLEKNERLFGIPVERLLTVDGAVRAPYDVYRKVEPVELSVLK